MRLEAYASPRSGKTPQTRLAPFKTLDRTSRTFLCHVPVQPSNILSTLSPSPHELGYIGKG